MKNPYVLAFAVGAGVALVAGVWLYRNRARFDPTNPDNFANVAAGAGVVALTGGAQAGGEDSVGGLFARGREWASGDDAAIKALTLGAPPRAPVDAAAGVGELSNAPDGAFLSP